MDKSTITYKLSQQDLLKEIYHIYENMFRNKSLVVEETLNLVRFYLEYIFRLNRLKTNDYIINIHAVKIDDDEQYLAYMHMGDRDNEFDVYLNRNRMKCNKALDILLINQVMYSAGHEFEHVIQFINNDNGLEDYLDRYHEIGSLIQKCYKKIKTKKLNGKEAHLQNDLDILHITEVNADNLSYIYYRNLLNDLIAICNDEFLLNYFEMIRLNLDGIYKDRKAICKKAKNSYKTYKKYFKRHGEKLDILD